MSVELSVPLGQVNLRQDISSAEVARELAAILGSSEVPGVEITIMPEIKRRRRGPPSLLVRFHGIEDAVVITESEIGVFLPQVTPDEANRWATMSVVGRRTPTSYLLAAAVAIALARKAGTVVMDDALTWCSELESSPDEFLTKGSSRNK
jgi:hypothetical protein